MYLSLCCYIWATHLLNATTYFKPLDEITAPLERVRITLANNSFNTPINVFSPQEKKPEVC